MDLTFRSLLDCGRSGKTLRCDFHGVEIVLKTADFIQNPTTYLEINAKRNSDLYYKSQRHSRKIYPRIGYGYYGGGWCHVTGTRIVGTHLSINNKISKREIPGALETLNEIHKRGILQGDIQAENVLLDCYGHLYLADFGMAHRLDQHRERELSKNLNFLICCWVGCLVTWRRNSMYFPHSK